MRNAIKSRVVLSILCVAAISAPLQAKSIEFNFKDPKGVNAMTFTLDSKLEPIMGLASGISGTINFDPVKPEKTTGTIVIESKSIITANKGMTKKLQAADWIDAKGYKTLSFTFKKIESVERDKKTVNMIVVGDFQCKGKTKEITVPISITFLPRKASDRNHGGDGDLLVLRTEFTIDRTDFGIKPNMGPFTVAKKIEIRTSIVGYSTKK